MYLEYLDHDIHRQLKDESEVFAGCDVSAVNCQGPTGGLIIAGEHWVNALDACVRPR